ncbi:hypothetical protein ALC57_05451 [Trachymyrmex cornetzi]|uniref:Uncharacterized protein n=1 Tax=Trachymyrmex cornetzi TaxID=471704 RepID=A0A195EBH4_9HYME|nr:hypothetical protein ALC57_05451 [Trachymyrmex cornetzi]
MNPLDFFCGRGHVKSLVKVCAKYTSKPRQNRELSETTDAFVDLSSPFLTGYTRFLLSSLSATTHRWPAVHSSGISVRQILTAQGVEWRDARRKCVLSVKRLFSVDVADVAHLFSVFSLNPSAAQTGEMAVLTTVSWGHCGGGGGSGNVVVEEDDGSRNFPARFGSQHPGAVLYR